MIEQRENKIDQIVQMIVKGLQNARFFGNRELVPYLGLLEARKQCAGIDEFVGVDKNMRLVYRTLEAWHMNKRRARMKPTGEFAAAIRQTLPALQALESQADSGPLGRSFLRSLESAFTTLDVMSSKAKFVANAKVLHFLFPDVLMPMDGKYMYWTPKTGQCFADSYSQPGWSACMLCSHWTSNSTGVR